MDAHAHVVPEPREAARPLTERQVADRLAAEYVEARGWDCTGWDVLQLVREFVVRSSRTAESRSELAVVQRGFDFWQAQAVEQRRLVKLLIEAGRELIAECDEHPGWEGHPHKDSFGFRLLRDALAKAGAR